MRVITLEETAAYLTREQFRAWDGERYLRFDQTPPSEWTETATGVVGDLLFGQAYAQLRLRAGLRMFGASR